MVHDLSMSTDATEEAAEAIHSGAGARLYSPEAEAVWGGLGEDEAAADVIALMLRLLRLCPGALPAPSQRADNADFAWSLPGMLAATAGQGYWERSARILTTQYGAPYSGEEDSAEVARVAELATGVSRFVFATPYKVACEWPDPPKKFVNLIMLRHILQHAVLTPDAQHIVTVLSGVSVALPVATLGETLTNATARRNAVGLALHLPQQPKPTGRKKKGEEPERDVWADAAGLWMGKLTTKNLVRQRLPTALPPCALHGPWTTVVPALEEDAAFWQHSVQLSGAWVASNGMVLPTQGDAADSLHTSWEVQDPFAANTLAQKHEYEAALPDEYDAVSPFDTFVRAFPNLDTSRLGPAASILFDLPLYAELLRPYVRSLQREFPPVVILPAEATPESSTNQGKSLATLCLARVMAPGIELYRAPDTGSAPDHRALAEVIRYYGTAALDEWRMPRQETHFFAHDNFQSLLTGGKINAGRALENGGDIALAHSVTLSTKWVNFPDDMINRCFFWHLGQLTRAQKKDGAMLEWVRSGRVSLLMRLGAWADIERNNIAERVNALRLCSGALRYEGLSGVAQVLCELRDVKHKDFERAVYAMQARFVAHVQEGLDNGMFRYTQQGLQFGFSDLFDVGAGENLHKLQVYMTDGQSAFATPPSFLQGLLQLYGHSRDAEYSKILGRLCDVKIATLSNRALATYVSKLIRGRLACGEYIMLPQLRYGYEGWGLVRVADHGNHLRFRLVNTLEEPDWIEKYGVVLADIDRSKAELAKRAAGEDALVNMLDGADDSVVHENLEERSGA